ncbi:amino acid ABC transporter substrate-binding protein [Abyssisolibacter fermentans]|uniref:amino acid ABC transporter substrate-binding protein n=1 Tax=Abyssisolibacter fermentans TaxID=1766203 RepID=UPI00082CFC29|nr:amino acid ABC transporter substrate-binding protein [Abyssisolibacter fermentans]
MKKSLILIIVVTMLATLFVGCSQKGEQGDNSLKEIKDKGKFILGLDDSFPPMGFRDQDGEIVGYDIDLAKEIAKRMGVELEVKPIDWDGNILSLNNKDIDVIWNGLSITEKRKEQILFSKEYAVNKQVIITNNDSKIDKKIDLKDKIVAVQLGSTGEEALNADTKIVESVKEVRKFSNFTEALLDLKAGRVDAVVIDEVVGKYYISKKAGDYKIASEDFGKEAYGVGFRKQDVKFRDEVDKILDDMREDGTMQKISEKWFGNYK